MDPDEVWWLIEAKKPRKTYGRLTEEEAEECYQEIMAEESAGLEDEGEEGEWDSSDAPGE